MTTVGATITAVPGARTTTITAIAMGITTIAAAIITAIADDAISG